MRETDAARLKALGLIEEMDGLLIPTDRGKETRHRKSPRVATNSSTATEAPQAGRSEGCLLCRTPTGFPNRSVEYRYRAAEALTKAKGAADDKSRAEFLQVAEVWKRMAE